MSSTKTVCAVSLGSLLVLLTGFFVVTEVRAGGIGDGLPLPVAVDQDMVAQATVFEGDYVFVGGQKQRDGLDAAIETTLDAVSPLVRGIGRKRLHETNPIPKQVQVAVNGEDVEITYDGFGHAAGLDGKPIKAHAPTGEDIKVSHRVASGKLTQWLDGAKGDRKNTLKLSSDGQRLTVDVEITSGHLPVPLEYRLTYKRK